MTIKNTARMIVVLATSLLYSLSSVAQEMEIDVLGLFKNSAMLKIYGKERLLKVGQRSEEGVLLVSADSKGAVIEVNGETMALDLSSRIAANFKRPTETAVSIIRNGAGQYLTRGTINGRSVQLLVDTGANVMALNADMARSLGIDPTEGRPIRVSTAGGMTESWLVTLDVVQIGNIKVNNVQAAVMQGSHPEDILLGMTFLQNVQLSESSGVMQLKGKY
ncbi:MAG: TIGR02281 family clan AA aspartic protease [Congregibacter sp.]|nr:TIGR02281 family clan AA aspartic protease [Congregibacter sp.]